jgi:ADP-glucose pyrophosphorylase
MLKIEKIKEEILNFDNSDSLSCYLAQIVTKKGDKNNCSRINTTSCSQCLKLSLMDLLEEYKEPIKLTKFEYEYLKVAKKEGFNFIARDKSNRLYGFEKQPTKGNATWASSGAYIGMFKSMFKFVQWKNEEPYSINSILSNCEVIEDEKS